MYVSAYFTFCFHCLAINRPQILAYVLLLRRLIIAGSILSGGLVLSSSGASGIVLIFLILK